MQIEGTAQKGGVRKEKADEDKTGVERIKGGKCEKRGFPHSMTHDVSKVKSFRFGSDMYHGGYTLF